MDKNSFLRVQKEETRISANYERGLLKDVLISLKENKLAMCCSVILLLILLVAVFAPLSPYDPDKQELTNQLARPSAEHWFGTDELGRDYFTRALYGGRISLSVGFLSMVLSTVIGTVIGTVSGYMGGKTDAFLMRFTDIFMSVPSFLLMVVINSLFPPKVWSMIVILGLFEWCQIARITRAETLSLKERDFVLASKADHIRTYHSQYEFFDHRCGKPCGCQGDTDRISFKLYGAWSTASQGILGNHASGSAGLYHGYAVAGHIPGDIYCADRIQLQYTWRRAQECAGTKDDKVTGEVRWERY